MAKRKKKSSEERLASVVRRLTRKFSPGVIQAALANQYEQLSLVSTTEPEAEFWFKCFRASKNLSSGMTKWAGDMIDELAEGEESETEGG